jgi:hypothetical protein
MAEMLLQLEETSGPRLEHIVQAVERAGGRVLQAWPPHALIVEATEALTAELKRIVGVVALHTGEVPAAAMEEAAEPFQLAATAWNNRRQRPSKRGSEGLSWDAPNHLPPDPPPHIRERLRRREQEEL